MAGAWRHQEEAVEWAMGRGNAPALLHLGMGCGKTRIALEIMLRIMRERDRFIGLVGCPKAVIAAWGKQAGLWAETLRVVSIVGSTPTKKRQIVEHAVADRSPLLLVGNYESISRLPILEKLAYDVICWDEVHRLKAHNGKASKWAGKLVGRNKQAKVLGLSGTMLADKPLGAWGVYRAVEAPECPTFGRSYPLFKAHYAAEHPFIRGMVTGYRNLDEMAEKIAATTFHRKTEDVIRNLPEKTHTFVDCPLSPEEGRVLTELTKEFAAEVDGGTITPKNAMEGLLRMLQACNGFCRFDDADEFSPIVQTPAKAIAFAELIEDVEQREPIVVFCRFRRDIEAVVAAATKSGRTVSELSGKANQLADWQAGETDVLVTQIASGGIGIDLTRASLCVFYSLGHSLSEYLQAVARLYRPGQTRATRFYHLVATLRGDTTVDGLVYKALQEKRDVIDGIVDYFKRPRLVGSAR